MEGQLLYPLLLLELERHSDCHQLSVSFSQSKLGPSGMTRGFVERGEGVQCTLGDYFARKAAWLKFTLNYSQIRSQK